MSNFTPKWARGIVWYQIFPERFCNGNPDVNPELEDQRGSWPHELESPYEVHPWTSDWYERQPYETHQRHGISDTIQRRRYGGDLAGIIQKLDYLKELGVGAIYLNPIFESPSSHKYDAATWHHVDPTFGPDPEGDRRIMETEVFNDSETWKWTSADKLLLELIQEAHKRQLYIIIDGVFNHMGLNSVAFRHLKKHGKRSPYKDWFKVTQWAEDAPDGELKVQTWEGFNELPEIMQNRQGLVAGPRQYCFDITRRWMDPHGNGDLSAGVDGWRLDVANCIKHPFWKKWRKHVRSINPEAYILGEVIKPVKTLKGYLKGDEFDAVMNYNFAFACSEFFIPNKRRIPVSKFVERLHELRTAFPEEVSHVMHNLLGSHDTDRVFSRIKNADLFTIREWWEYYELSKAKNPEYDTSQPGDAEKRILKLMKLFQFTYPGAPVIYYGDEAGLWGANDPCNRKPMLWPEHSYDPERIRPDGKAYEQTTEVAYDHELAGWVKKLAKIRNESTALREGAFEIILQDDENDTLAFSRKSGNEHVVVVINNSRKEQAISLPQEQFATLKLAASSGKAEMNEVKSEILISGKSGVVLG